MKNLKQCMKPLQILQECLQNMKTLYILEAEWRDTIGRTRKQDIVGVYDDILKLEKAKQAVEDTPHKYTSITYKINTEMRPFA